MKKLLAFILAGLANLAYSQINLLNGLQACYPLDCDIVNYAPTSGTPPSLDGTGFNVSCATGHAGVANTAWHFAGLPVSYISLPNDVRIKPDSISFTGWFYLDTLPSEQYLLYTKNNCTSNFEAYYLCTYLTATGQRFSVGKSNGACTYAQLSSNTTLSAGNWYHVAFFMNNSVIKLYVNGSFDNSMTHSISFSYNTNKTVILGGTNETSYNWPFTGRMDNLRFYNRQLNASEVYDIYTRDPGCRSIEKPTGIATQEMSGNETTVYPNPSNGKLYVSSMPGYTFMLQDISGKNVAFNQAALGNETAELQLVNKTEGIYFLKTLNEHGQVVQITKIIITR